MEMVPPRYEHSECTASSSIARVRLRAQLIGQEVAAALLKTMHDKDLYVGDPNVTPRNVWRKAEADELLAHALLTPEEHARIAKPR